MDKLFSDRAFDEYFYWMEQDHNVIQRINVLLEDIERKGAEHGLGKPKRLKYVDVWSLRINDGNQLIYTVEDQVINIFGCKGHYDD